MTVSLGDPLGIARDATRVAKNAPWQERAASQRKGALDTLLEIISRPPMNPLQPDRERILDALMLGMPTLTTSRYPRAAEVVSGLRVRPHIPNTTSIPASLDKWVDVPGVREVPMADFPGITGKSYSVSEDARIGALADAIRQSREISPLIVVKDAQGPYVLEGGHRIDALKRIGIRSFPARVVYDRTGR